MRIQHNVMAMNSYRNYNNNVKSLSGNLEKLSSGYRINRAGDDAAGLAISEKMRAQITGLDAAQKNVKDGISLVKTAEGAMQEIQDMLNRMKYLAVQSANGTYEDEVDRENLQKEVDSLKEEINRIADSANFNGRKLLDGSLAKEGATGVGSVTVDLSALKGNMLSAVTTVDATKGTYTSAAPTTDITLADTMKGDVYEYTFEYTDNNGNHQQKVISFELTSKSGVTGFGDANGDAVFKAEDGTEYVINSTAATGAAKEINTAIVSELAKDEEFSANFKALESTKADGSEVGTLSFTAAQAGTGGAELLSVTATKTAASDGKVSHSNATVTVGQSQVGSDTAVGTAGATTAVNSFKALDLSKATIWNGDAAKLEDAIFEINGEKFVFINKSVDVASETVQNALSDAGVGNNYVSLTTADTIDGSDDISKMVEVIGRATGLSVEQGKITVGSTNVWAADTADTGIYVALKDSVTAESKPGGGLTLQIGDTADEYNQLNVHVNDMHVKALGIEGFDISTLENAQAAEKMVTDAINLVSSTRGDLGAIQNRLEHTANNLSVMEENIQDAESTIRDTDVADEMMAYTKNNILIQSAQAMLAQANAVPQGVLQLLQ